jgi:hypothetical protein
VVEKASAARIKELATAVQTVLTADDPPSLNEPDQALRKLLLDWRGPLGWLTSGDLSERGTQSEYGLNPAMFGSHPDGLQVDGADLCLKAPQVVEVRLPAELAAGAEFVTTVLLHPQSNPAAGAQCQVLFDRPGRLSYAPAVPILVRPDSQGQQHLEAALTEFRNLFPPALCYARIVPVDEVVTLTLFHREDDHLRRLMLTEEETAEIDRLWEELYYISQEPLKLVTAFEQISEFATQDRPDLVQAFAPLRQPIHDRAEAFRRRLIEHEPAHVNAVLEFAGRAWRRPLTAAEEQTMRELYRHLRDDQIAHEAAVQMLLARVLTSPAFLYKLEQPAPGQHAAPVSDLELASRLSYFLWSSVPDAELRNVAEAGRLAADDMLVLQTERMLKDARTRRLAIHFACQWLHLRDFDQNDEKNERMYPEFAELRDDMYEETVRFCEDLFRNDGSILDLLDADHTFLNESLAQHYGIAGVTGDEWRRVERVRSQGRGGILGMATFLASQSGASRTSPILRGNWVYETLLGERLPKPPPGVPQLPESVPDGLTARQLIERHSAEEACAAGERSRPKPEPRSWTARRSRGSTDCGCI